MTKYELFKKIADEMTPLIINLEKDISRVLSTNPPEQKINAQKTNNFGGRLKGLARSVFTSESNENIINLYKNRKRNLESYSKLDNKLKEIFEDTIKENISNNTLSENSSEISILLSNFREKFISIIKNIASELQVDYDKEKSEYMQKAGSDAAPEEMSDGDIEAMHSKNRSTSQIDVTLEEFSKLSDQKKYEALLEMYAVTTYEDDKKAYSDLHPLLKKIINENKYKEAKDLLPIELQKKLDEEIRDLESTN